MRVRTIKAHKVQTQPGQVDELVRRWREQVAPRIPEMSGLRDVSTGHPPAGLRLIANNTSRSVRT